LKQQALIVSVLVVGLTLTTASTGGSPGGYSSAPGESNCASCHGTFPLDSGPNTFTVGAPASSAGLVTVPVQVSLADAGAPKSGFEVSARDAAGNKVSTWQITDGTNTKLVSGNVTQTSSGTSKASWDMTWDVPASLPAGPITFYACGLDGNGGGTSGDYVYTATAEVYQAEITAAATVWPLGSTQALQLSAPTRPNDEYIVGMSDGTSPTPIPGGLVLPIDLGSPLFKIGISNPTIFQNFIGTLDGAGNATAQVFIPPLPILSGFELHFAFAAVVPGVGVASEVSNRVSVTIQ